MSAAVAGSAHASPRMSRDAAFPEYTDWNACADGTCDIALDVLIINISRTDFWKLPNQQHDCMCKMVGAPLQAGLY